MKAVIGALIFFQFLYVAFANTTDHWIEKCIDDEKPHHLAIYDYYHFFNINISAGIHIIFLSEDTKKMFYYPLKDALEKEIHQ